MPAKSQRKRTQGKRKPYVRIEVSGGAAEVTLGANAVDFDILDWDILKMAAPGDFNRDYLSPRAQRYLKAQDPELFARFYPERSR